MAYLQLLVVMATLYLFLLFLAQPFLIACRVASFRWSEARRYRSERLGPDDVDAEPALDLGDIPGGYRIELGKDRFGRTIWTSGIGPDARYYYFDRAASEAMRIERAERPDPRQDSEPLSMLGWKGFTADSMPWEVLGVARDASIDQIKWAYRTLIAKFHPDRYQNLSSSEVEGLEQDAKLINAAYAEMMRS